MPKSCFNLVLSFVFLVLAQTAAGLELSQSPSRLVDYCQSGKPVRRVRAFFSQEIPRPPRGMPLDMALEHEQVSVRRIREKARAYFRTNPPPDLERMMQEYTFLIPQAMKEKWSPGELLGLSEISAAVKYRRHYWELYLEKFTTAKEAAGRDPYTMRFEVELDLAIFCGYRQPVRNLVAGGS